MTRKVAASGNRYSFLGFIDDSGYLVGATPSQPANGASSGMVQLVGIKEAAPTVPEPDTDVVTGDDIAIAEFDYESIGSRRYIAEYAVESLTLLAQILNLSIETIAGAESLLMDIANAPERNVCLIHQSRMKKQDAGQTGLKGWQAAIILLATAQPLGRVSFSERTGASFRMSITPQLASRNPWGASLYSADSVQIYGRQRVIHLDYPLHMQAFTGAGSAAAITLDYPPVSTDRVAIYANNVPVAVSAISAANKTATPGASIATGARGVVVYQFQPPI